MLLKELEEEVTYLYHPDHLGSVSVVSDQKGLPYERVEYLPFGEVWIEETDPATGYIPFRFTELDEETGLYYHGARYYEPTISRWMSADPAGFALSSPMGSDWKPKASYSIIEAANWYAYVSHNPVIYVDPTGEETISFGMFVSGSSGISGKLESGIAIGFDKKRKVLSIGIYSTVGAGGAMGTGVSGGITAAATGADSVGDLKSKSTTVGGSGGFLGILGYDVTVPAKSDNLLEDTAISVSAGMGVSAEMHVLITETKVAATEIDISAVAEKIDAGIEKIGAGIAKTGSGIREIGMAIMGAPGAFFERVSPPLTPGPF